MDDSRVELDGLQSRIGYSFSQEKLPLLVQALTRKAYAEEEVQAGRRCEFQESLSFLGDAVLRAALSELLIERGWSSKDDLHRERKDLENNERLTEVGEKLVTRAVIRMNKSESDSWETNKTTVLSDTMEALIGAIHRAAGYEESKARVESWFKEFLKGRDCLSPQ